MIASELSTYLAHFGYLAPGEPVSYGIARFQGYFQEALDAISKRVHGRALIVDGESGPATEELILTPRCGCPDFAMGDGPLEANWPTNCREELRVYIATGGLRVKDGEAIEAFRDALDSWEEEIVVGFMETDDRNNAHIWNDVAPLSGGVLAWSYLAQNSCSVRLQQRYNSRVDWDKQYLRAVVAHEYGHALGSGHLNDPGSLMYPYARRDIYRPKEADVRQMIRLGYKDRANEPDPEPPTGKLLSVFTDTNEAVLEFRDGTKQTWKFG